MPTLPTGFTAIRLASTRMDLHHTYVSVVEVRLPHRLPGVVMKCPWCQQYSMTYDFERNSWACHVYNGETYDERMPS